MAIVFSEEDLKDITPPCVLQSFINHNALLYKVFVVGETYRVVERPSIRNFPSGPTDRKAISFNSHHVSKPESSSHLTSRENVEGTCRAPSDDVIQKISRCLRQILGVSLFGIDIIINNQTGQHAVIDINAFPGYEGVPTFFDDLLTHLTSVLQGHAPFRANGMTPLPCGMLGNMLGSEGVGRGMGGEVMKNGVNRYNAELESTYRGHRRSPPTNTHSDLTEPLPDYTHQHLAHPVTCYHCRRLTEAENQSASPPACD